MQAVGAQGLEAAVIVVGQPSKDINKVLRVSGDLFERAAEQRLLGDVPA